MILNWKDIYSDHMMKYDDKSGNQVFFKKEFERLLKRYDLATSGIWKINAHGYTTLGYTYPLIGYFAGTYEQAIKKALEFPSFFKRPLNCIGTIEYINVELL